MTALLHCQLFPGKTDHNRINPILSHDGRLSFYFPQGANSPQTCRGDIKGPKCSQEFEYPTRWRQAGGGQAEDKGTAAHQVGSFEMQVPFFVFSHIHFFRAQFLVFLA